MSPKRLLILAALTASTACAFAQASDEPLIPPEEFVIGTSIPDILLQRADIRQDLQLSVEQTMKFYDVEATLASTADPQTIGAAPDATQGLPKPTFDAVRRRIIDQVDKILSPDQLKRLKQIALQLSGYSALGHADVQRSMDLPKDLVVQIDELVVEEHRADDSVFEKFQDGDITPDQLPEIVKKNRSALNLEIGKLLTQSQKDQFKALGGKPFKANPNL